MYCFSMKKSISNWLNLYVSISLLSLTVNGSQSNELSTFELTLNLDGDIHSFPFIEISQSNQNYSLPLTIILDNDQNSTLLPSSMLRSYHVESDKTSFSFATIFHHPSFDSNLLYATIQTTNGSWYDISPSMAMIRPRQKRNLHDDLIVRQNNIILPQASVSISWPQLYRSRRDVNDVELSTESPTTGLTRETASDNEFSSTIQSVSMPDSMENITLPSADNETESMAKLMPITTPRPIPAKTRHIYLELVAVIDSLIVQDVRALLNKTELESIEILKLYYIHIFMGVEQLYRQSLIYETLDVHIRLSKLIFATDKHRLPWESFKNISSLSNAYRKNPNNAQLRPNVSMSLLKSLHHAYSTDNFLSKYSIDDSDHIMTFTRLDLIDGAGSAYVLGTCLPAYKYSIVQEDLNAFSVLLTVTHELGHNLGLNHDETENQCDEPTVRYIMSPKNMNTPGRQQIPYFSPCSIEQLNYFADNTTTTCWKNSVISTRNDTDLDNLRQLTMYKLGQIIDIHQQCQLQYGPDAIPFVSINYNQKQSLYEEGLCNQLRCFKKPEDEYMYWQDGAFDGTVCGENHVCHQQKCVPINGTMKTSHLSHCPYGDLFIPIPMLNLLDTATRGNMRCPEALNLLRSRGLNVTQLCYDSTMPYERLCCEECKKHRIPECGDGHVRCPSFAQYCQMEFMRINGVPITELCPYTCGLCKNLPTQTKTTTTTTTTTMKMTTVKSKAKKKTTTRKMKLTTSKPRKYVKPKTFDRYTCIDSADCAQLVKVYSKLKKNVKNWCHEHTTMYQGHYFAERCPKYCSLCNVKSECEEQNLCQNNGTCIRDEHGTYQCLCSSSKSYYGTLCEYRQTCRDNPCSSNKEYCIQTRGEDFICLSSQDKENLRIILNGKKTVG